MPECRASVGKIKRSVICAVTTCNQARQCAIRSSRIPLAFTGHANGSACKVSHK